MRPLARRLSDVEKERSVCGFRQRLLKKDDGAPASVTYLAVYEAGRHYHNETTEYYYVLEGTGVLHLDDETIALEPNMVVWIPPGVKHSAEGDVKVLVICVPAFDAEDQYVIE